MKMLLLTFSVLAGLGTGFALFISEAEAACPPGTRYMCIQTYNGKMRCGCF